MSSFDGEIYEMSFVALLERYSFREIAKYYEWAERRLTNDDLDLIRESVPVIGEERKVGKNAANAIASLFWSVEDTLSGSSGDSENELFAKFLLLCRYMGSSYWFDEDAYPASVSVVFEPNCSLCEILFLELLQDQVPFVNYTISEWQEKYKEADNEVTRFPFATVPQIKIDGVLLEGGYNGYMRTFHDNTLSDPAPVHLQVKGIHGSALAAAMILLILEDSQDTYLSSLTGQLKEVITHLRKLLENVSLPPDHCDHLYSIWEKWIRTGKSEEHEQIRSFVNVLKATGCAPTINHYF